MAEWLGHAGNVLRRAVEHREQIEQLTKSTGRTQKCASHVESKFATLYSPHYRRLIGDAGVRGRSCGLFGW
jgi:hypothetical protein